MMGLIDVMFFDIQDIGVRSYTYIYTMAKAMEACAEFDVQFIVLDRPNPLGGLHVEGNILDTAILERLRKEQGGGSIDWLIDLYLGELPAYLSAIKNALEKQDSKELYLAAHKCKGGSANLGALKLVALCRNIEALGRAGKIGETGGLVANLEPEGERVRLALEKYKDA